MSEEITELFQLSNGKYVVSEDLSEKLFYIKKIRPERPYQDDSTGYEWNESGMAELFAQLYHDTTRFCPEIKSWYTYDAGRWQKDTGSLLVSAKIKEFVRLMALYCGEIPDEEKRKHYLAFVSRMGDRRFRERLAKDAADQLRIEAAEFDADPYLINCRNGTYDLRTFTFRQHDPADLLTMQTAFDYTLQHVTCPRWESFIREITQDDLDKADYLQRALGYSILGTSKEECMFILHGRTTRNGKSTLLDAIQHLLGDYSTVAPVELICRTSGSHNNPNAHTSTLARLKGRRFVTMAESDTAGKLDESVIKQYTGGEEITAREIYQSAITFTPQFTFWLSCNDLPAVRDKSLFASDRIRVIEFNRHFSDSEQDKNLKDFFRSPDAMKGIFAWLVAGYSRYTREGLHMADHLQLVIRQYARDNDIVLQFLEENCQHDSEATIRAKNLYDNFKIWCKSTGYFAMSAKKFSAEIVAHPDWCLGQQTGHARLLSFVGLKMRENG